VREAVEVLLWARVGVDLLAHGCKIGHLRSLYSHWPQGYARARERDVRASATRPAAGRGGGSRERAPVLAVEEVELHLRHAVPGANGVDGHAHLHAVAARERSTSRSARSLSARWPESGARARMPQLRRMPARAHATRTPKPPRGAA